VQTTGTFTHTLGTIFLLTTEFIWRADYNMSIAFWNHSFLPFQKSVMVSNIKGRIFCGKPYKRYREM